MTESSRGMRVGDKRYMKMSSERKSADRAHINGENLANRGSPGTEYHDYVCAHFIGGIVPLANIDGEKCRGWLGI